MGCVRKGGEKTEIVLVLVGVFVPNALNIEYIIYIQVHHLSQARARTLELIPLLLHTHAFFYIILNYVPDQNFQTD